MSIPWHLNCESTVCLCVLCPVFDCECAIWARSIGSSRRAGKSEDETTADKNTGPLRDPFVFHASTHVRCDATTNPQDGGHAGPTESSLSAKRGDQSQAL